MNLEIPILKPQTQEGVSKKNTKVEKKPEEKRKAAKPETMADKELEHREYQEKLKQEMKNEEIEDERMKRAKSRGLRNQFISYVQEKLLGIQTSDEGTDLKKIENAQKAKEAISNIGNGMKFSENKTVTKKNDKGEYETKNIVWTIKNKLEKNGKVEWLLTGTNDKSRIISTEDIEAEIKNGRFKLKS